MWLIAQIEPHVHDGVLGISDEVVILPGFYEEHVTRGYRLPAAVDFDPTSSLHDDEDLVIRMFLLGAVVSAKSRAMKTQTTLENVALRADPARDMLRTARP